MASKTLFSQELAKIPWNTIKPLIDEILRPHVRIRIRPQELHEATSLE
jgi:hypothetical protein